MDWPTGLPRLEAQLLELLAEEGDDDPPDRLSSPPATEAQIAAAEARLGIRFPAAYRQFLAVSDGWHYAAGFPFGLARLLDTTRVFWMRADRAREPARFRAYLAQRPQLLDPPAGPGEDLLDRLLCIGDLDGNECILAVVGARTDDWPLLLWDPELGFDEVEGLGELFARELEVLE